MAQTEEAIFHHGNQLNVDHTPVAAESAGDLVKVADDGSDNVLWGVVNSAIEAGDLGSADIKGIYKFKKGAVAFTQATLIGWDFSAKTAVAAGTAGAWDLAICLYDAASGDDYVIGLLLGTVVAVGT